MRVLDLGCGIGEVSLITARLVGPHGQVHGIDLDRTGNCSDADSLRRSRSCDFRTGGFVGPFAVRTL